MVKSRNYRTIVPRNHFFMSLHGKQFINERLQACRDRNRFLRSRFMKKDTLNAFVWQFRNGCGHTLKFESDFLRSPVESVQGHSIGGGVRVVMCRASHLRQNVPPHKCELNWWFCQKVDVRVFPTPLAAKGAHWTRKESSAIHTARHQSIVPVQIVCLLDSVGCSTRG